MTSSIRPVALHETLECEGIGDLLITSVKQRNWSRVARAEQGDTQYFVKQFVDRVGGRHDWGFRGDYEVMSSLGDELSCGVRVVPLLGRIEDRLVSISPHIEMSTIDSINWASARHGERARRVGFALRSILEGRGVPDDPTTIAVWKGLDPKNIGWTESGDLWIFDFGPPVELSRSTAAARVVAAGLLSRWVARPGTHVVWPERSILRGICEPIADLTDLEQINLELAKHAKLRLREPQRTGMAAFATRLGLRTVGRLHWATVEREARRLYVQRD